MRRRQALLLPAALAARPALAQESYPSRPIRLVVPFPPGGAVDAWARILADALAPRLGQPIVVENRAGAAGLLGAEAVARAAPDGYTLLFTIDALAQVPVLLRRFPYDPERDFQPIGQLGTTAIVLTLGPAVPAEIATLDQFIAWGQGRPLLFGNWGGGGTGHAVSILFAREAGLDVEHVSYRGEPPMVSDFLAGRFHAAFVTTITFGELIRAGRLRPLASIGGERIPSLADRVPTLGELGRVRGLDYQGYSGLFAPAGLPAPVKARLASAFAAAGGDPELLGHLRALDTLPRFSSPEAFAATVATGLRRWREIVDELRLWEAMQ